MGKLVSPRAIFFWATLPVWIGYLLFGIAMYVGKKDDAHFAILNDIVGWFLDGWNGI